ncbi:MAG: hypothetical protein OXG81_07540 [Acidobacteria bacterium]|nr:hypothetical protein [Acidobacteriota bacterium]MCY3933832.1 hypothetical protein [Acidobacteriota bacterium]
MTPTTGTLRNTLLLALVAALLTVACSGYGAPALPAAVGSWNMTIETPLGTQEPTLIVSGDASGLMGVMSSPQGDVELTEMSWSDDGTLGFVMDIDAGGQSLSLAFSGMVDGDTLTGAFASDFGDMEANATRVVE